MISGLHMRLGRFALAAVIVLAPSRLMVCAAASAELQPAPAASADGPRAPAVWPRTFQNSGNTLVVYTPQVDAWKDFSKIRFRMAFCLTPASTGQQHYGVAAAQADTLVDHDARTVLMTNMDVAVRFPGMSDDQAAPFKALVKQCLPNLNYLDLSLDQVLASQHAAIKVPTANLNLQPPPIFYSDSPALLVVYLGPPQFKPVKDTGLMFAVNTNWVVLMDMATSQYYLLDGDSWLTSPDPLAGPWTPAQSLPAGLSSLPSGGNWDDVRKHVPGQPITSVPRVLTTTEPAELITTVGPPDYTPVAGTRLMYVSNPVMPLFLDLTEANYYYLVSGRWFRSDNVAGPWTAASADLPAEFAKIPPDSPVGFVLASVPKTQEAQDAILLASVPHKATIKIADTTVAVTYDGAPKFVPIPDTSMTYAVNTSYQVVFASGQYYCCYQGVWFLAPIPTGPWAVCTSVPAVIYTIPPSCPVYNVTYVQVYSTTPTTVVVGYTGGYSGEYVAATGALMFGAGMLTGALLASNDNCCWYGCSPCYYSYGCAAHYSYAYGGYYRAAGSYYGPHGGAGWGSSYNAATGTWARAGYAYGPEGAHWGAQAYNPFTNTYAAHTGGSSGYQSWGHSYVQQGNAWAEAGHQSGVRGSAGWAENSSGQSAEGVHSNATDTSLAKTSNGDVYAGHDGNVYKQSNGQWQKYQGNGSWSDTSWNRTTPTTYQHPSSSAASENSWQASMQNRSQTAAQNTWKSSGNSSDWSNDSWKNNWENRSDSGGGGGAQNSWSQHDTESRLNQDSWSRERGQDNAQSSWAARSGGDRWGGGGGGGGWGGGGGRGGGGGGRFRR